LAKSYTAKYLKTKKEFDAAIAKADRESFDKRRKELARQEAELKKDQKGFLEALFGKDDKKKDRGRKGKDPADVALQSLNRAIQQGFRRAERVNKKLFTQQEKLAKKQEDIDRKRREDFERAMEARNKEIKEFEAATIDARPLAAALGIETTKEGLISLQGVIGQTKDKLLDMGVSMASSVMQGVGAMAHGSKSLSEFGDDMATALGGMAVQWGEFFLGVGSGMLFIPGMAGTGAGLILAGLGLTALGGYLGALGKGPSATASSSTDTRAMARDILPKEDRQRETYVQVFVAGDQIRDPIWRTMNEGIRTGRVQTMGA
jgi:hypothetical protein